MNERPHGSAEGAATSIDPEFARQALQRMAFIRCFEEACLKMSAGADALVAGSIHLCAGQEAIAVGACAATNDEDRILATYRGHGWAIEAGLDPFEILSEICHRETGINGGRGGSAYFMGPGTKFVGENSIVGAGAAIANGVALAMGEKKGVVLVSIGDGAMNQGALHEAIVFAAYKKLPVIFVCENNGWSEMTPIDRIVPIERLSRRAAGYGISGATIDGCDPIAVRDTISLAIDHARAGKGPSLIECKTVRLWGHYNRDIEHYRPKADRLKAADADPIRRLRGRLLAKGLFSESELDADVAAIKTRMEELIERVTAAPKPDPARALLHVVAEDDTPPHSKLVAVATELTYQQAVNDALRDELTERPEVLVFGEDVGFAGGIFGCTRNLQREFGEERVFDTPIAEASILGAAVGASMCGLRPVAEIMWMDFLLVALDQLVNQAANVRYVTQGKDSAPMVVRLQQGATPGSCAQHSQCLEAFLAHVPGLKVGIPSTPQDAYDMLRAAVADNDPCVIIESRALYQTNGQVTKTISKLGSAKLRREGSDVAIISWGAIANRAEEAAQILSAKGVEAAVLDLRWIAPLDETQLISVVKQCGGRAVIVHEANLSGGFGAEIAARLSERGFANFQRLGTPNTRIPASPVLQAALLPSVEAIVAAVDRVMSRASRPDHASELPYGS
ncbi:alpha-ketoacid dehydrogenase subunit alpha/beta [Bradyrhizobium sp. CW1]|uniref:alpha-ketoacid dehydrogenase subunit alpha/beta n=1 Tax=Bradyrhizobium sp. CW1 TaxID=2782686 RepID=UPI00200012EE|nr:alpha-ketoacid dehydrogenase subunit alpha/beta [Bradyrhizobium sp. CW1]UPJ26390.1 transketolase [Bradyrhizobium sp. CW1]